MNKVYSDAVDFVSNLVGVDPIEMMKKNSKLLTEDPIKIKNQNFIARFLINNDRGINVREKSQYLKLLRVHFRKLKSKVTHQPFPPYTWFTTICMK